MSTVGQTNGFGGQFCLPSREGNGEVDGVERGDSMSKKDSECVERVKKYLEQQNRPYSVNDIFLNLHKEIGKTAVQKALDHLTAVSNITP